MMNIFKRKGLMAVLLITMMLISGCSTTVPSEADSPLEVTEQGESALPSNDYSSLFADDVIHEIDIEINASDWAALLANPEDEVYYETTVTLDGVKIKNVGFRTKGNSSLKSVARSDSERYSFRVKFDKYVDDQTFSGLDELVLNNMFSDPSYMREYISYDVMKEAGLIVPESAFVNVKIGGEHVGFYLMVEAIDDSFLVRNFGDNDGDLYKAESGSNLLVDQSEMYNTLEHKNGEDENKTDLAKFITILNEMPTGEKGDIESVLNVDSALNYFAANLVLENFDSYNGQFAQNYYLYQSEGKFTVIPWDYNMSFGGFPSGSAIDIDMPISGTTMDKVPLIDHLLSVPEYKERYEGYIEQYITLLSDIEERVEALQLFIGDSVKADPSKFSTYESFVSATTYDEDLVIDLEKDTSAPINNMPRPNDVPANQPPMGDKMRPGGDAIGGERGGDRGGGMDLSGSDTSIINITLARIQNLKEQLGL